MLLIHGCRRFVVHIAREAEDHRCTFAGVGLYVQRSSVGRNDFMDDRQTDPGAAISGPASLKWLQDAGLQASGDSLSIIAYRHARGANIHDDTSGLFGMNECIGKQIRQSAPDRHFRAPDWCHRRCVVFQNEFYPCV